MIVLGLLTEKLPRIVLLGLFTNEFNTELLLAIATIKDTINTIRNFTPHILVLNMLNLILCWYYVLSSCICSIYLIGCVTDFLRYDFDFKFFHLIKLII